MLSKVGSSDAIKGKNNVIIPLMDVDVVVFKNGSESS